MSTQYNNTGVLTIVWKVDGRRMDEGDFFDLVTDDDMDTDALWDVYSIVEKHIVASGYKKAELFKDLEQVDVEFIDDAPSVPVLSFEIPPKPLKISATFELFYSC